MQFINYFFASLVSFFGLLIGIILVSIAPEEQKPLSKYFDLIRKILLLLIFVFLMFYYFNRAFYLLILFLYLIFAAVIEYRIKDSFRKSMLNYILLGILFYASQNNINLFVIESSLILLYGAVTASLLYDRKSKNYFKLLFYNIGFLIIANILYFI
ncbi:TPA: hypothetical protein DEQ89_05630 [Candidatus Daviesbacteria bacterium]|nr:hypothetical protein [Candidatus Daviesbacteria bacterium]